MYLLQLSVSFILSIPFHQIVETWCPLLRSSSGNFGTLSPESSLIDFSEAFLTPRTWGGGAPLFWVPGLPLHVGVCGDGHALIWSSQLPLPCWALSSVTTIPFPYFSCSSCCIFLENSIWFLHWLSRPSGSQVQGSRNLWPKSLDTPHRRFYSVVIPQSHGVPEGLQFPRILLRIGAHQSSHFHQTYLGFLVPYQEVSGVLCGSWRSKNKNN